MEQVKSCLFLPLGIEKSSRGACKAGDAQAPPLNGLAPAAEDHKATRMHHVTEQQAVGFGRIVNEQHVCDPVHRAKCTPSSPLQCHAPDSVYGDLGSLWEVPIWMPGWFQWCLSDGQRTSGGLACRLCGWCKG